jgi:hypothetical protein
MHGYRLKIVFVFLLAHHNLIFRAEQLSQKPWIIEALSVAESDKRVGQSLSREGVDVMRSTLRAVFAMSERNKFAEALVSSLRGSYFMTICT